MKKFRIAVATLAFVFSAPLPGRADDQTCRMPSGFIDNGIGGTGLNDQKGDEGKGIGGTGAKYNTAYVSGTIYAFGSICVNGLRIAYDDNTKIEGDVPGKSLQIGQVVDIEADITNGLHAKSIHPRYEIAGPVDFVDAANGYIFVMGTKIDIGKNSDIRTLTPGARIGISGARNAKGELVASLLAARKNGSPDIIRGVLQKGADGGLYIGRTKVDFYRLNTAATALGSPVEVAGTWNGKFLEADGLMRLKPVQKPIMPGTYFSYEGYLESIGPNKTVRLGGITMTAKDLLCGGEPLEPGERLVAMGSIDSSGRIIVDGFADAETPATHLSLEPPEPQ